MSGIVNISFSKFAEYCKYCKLGMDIDHQVEVTCRSPENHPKGCSWGMCNESDCPALRLNESMGKDRGSITIRAKIKEE